jgi:hypothetical protein
MMLVSVKILGTIPLGSFDIPWELKAGLRALVSWVEVHSYYYQITQAPAGIVS